MNITFKQTTMNLEGTQPKVGDKLSNFQLFDKDLNKTTLADLSGLKVFVVVPSVDTGVCDAELRKFNEKATSLNNVTICGVSVDLPFALGRWCGAAGVENVKLCSDYFDRSFAKATGTMIAELQLLTRAIFIVDQDNVVKYVQIVPEVSDHPNYDEVFTTLSTLV